MNKTIKTVWCITFYVSDPKKAMQFYEETLCLEKKYEYSSYVSFECGEVKIGLISKLNKGEHVTPISPSVGFLVNDVEKFYNELRGKDVAFVKELREGPQCGKQATSTDPDGNILEIVKINWKNASACLPKG